MLIGNLMSGFLNWWQYLPYNINHVIFEVYGFSICYYGLGYVIAFCLTYYLAYWRIRNEIQFSIYSEELQNLMVVMFLGVFIGGRLGFVLLYNLSYYIQFPLEVFLPIKISDSFIFIGFSGMSYHGGLFGCIVMSAIFFYFKGINFFKISDLVVPTIPLGYTFGRIGNFANGELYGRLTSLPIGMYFPATNGDGLRHPTQLYEALMEGLVLFVILWILKDKIKTSGIIFGLYLVCYGLIRCLIENVRQVDFFVEFAFFSLTIGQLLCISMVFVGIVYIFSVKMLFIKD